jgi:hypothetical protein
MADEQYTRELAEYLKTYFSAQKRQIEHTRALRALLHTVNVPEVYRTTAQVIKTPVLADMVQRLTATLTVNYPTWRRTPIGASDKAQDQSSLVEKWLTAAHRRMEDESNRSVFRQVMSAAIGDGMGVMQYTWLPENWKGFPRKAEEEQGKDYLARTDEYTMSRPFPFGWRDVDPLSFFVYEPNEGDAEVLVIQRLPLAPTASRLGVRRDDSKKWVKAGAGKAVPPNWSGAGEDVEVICHWSKTQVCWQIDGDYARTDPNPWGEVPFVWFSGLSSHENTPERAFLPVAFAFEHLIPLLDSLLTMKSNWMYLSAFPQQVLKLSNTRLQGMATSLGVPEQRTANLPTIELGKVLTLYEGEDHGFSSPPPVGTDLNQMIQLVMGLIDNAGIGQVLKGSSPGGDPTGYLYQQMVQAARLTYEPITANFRQAGRKGGSLLLKGVDRLAKRAVAVYGDDPKDSERQKWLMLGPKDLGGNYNVDCEMEPLLPSNKILEGQFGLQQYSAGAISMQTHREDFLHLAEPEREEKRRLSEEFKSSKIIHDIALWHVGEEAGWFPAGTAARKTQELLGGVTDSAPAPPPGGGGVTAPGRPVQPGLGMPMTQEGTAGQQRGPVAVP